MRYVSRQQVGELRHLQAPEDASTAEALAALRAEVRCIKHTRAMQQGRALGQGRAAGQWQYGDEGAESKIARLEEQLAQMEVHWTDASCPLSQITHCCDPCHTHDAFLCSHACLQSLRNKMVPLWRMLLGNKAKEMIHCVM